MCSLYSSYSDLPKYIVYSGDVSRACKTSYGIALVSKSGTTLQVKPVDNFSFVIFFRGVYHQAKIPFLIRSMTTDEYNLLLECIESVDVFNKTFYTVNEKYSKDCIRAYARRRLLQSEVLIRKCASLPSSKSRYGYPKGQPRKDEAPLDCAKRELLEETGIDLDCINHVLTDRVLEKSYTTASGLEYKDIIYVIEVDEEYPCLVGDSKEVLKVKWRVVDCGE